MTLVAGVVLDKARDRHASFDRKAFPDRMLRRYLSDYVRQLHGKVNAIDPEALRINYDVALPLVDHEAGIPLPANARLVDEVVAADKSDPTKLTPIDLIPAKSRNDRNAPFAAAWQIGSTLYLRSPASAWSAIGTIGIAYVPLPTELADANAVLALPDAAELACVEAVAKFMAGRGSLNTAAPPIDIAKFEREAARAEESYLDDAANRGAGQVFLTRDVYP